MDSMKIDWYLIFLILLATNLNLVQGLRKISPAEEVELEKQLKLINKPTIKSFKVTLYFMLIRTVFVAHLNPKKKILTLTL